MLEFWFDPKVSITRKLLIFVSIAIITAVLYGMQPLALDAILMFSGTGIIFNLPLLQNALCSRAARWLALSSVNRIPIALLLALIFMNMKEGEILLPCTGNWFYGTGRLSVLAFIPST